MMKKLILKLMQIYWNRKFSKMATIKGKAHFGRHTKIQLLDGSCKSDIKIGENVKLYGTIISQNHGQIIIENNVHIGPFTTIGAINLVRIKSFSMISKNVDIIDNNNHPTHPDDRKTMNKDEITSSLKSWRHSKAAAIIIGENTWIGKNSTVMKGVEIGENTIVGACSVVTKSMPANVIAAGNPAKVVKVDIQEEEKIF